MQGDQIPDADHIARVCKGTELRESDGSPSPSAFCRADVDGISCNWVEYFQGSPQMQLSQVKAAIALRRTVKNSYRLAVINVGHARAKALSDIEIALSVIEDPLPAEGDKPPDPSHSLVEQVEGTKRAALGDVLASCVLQHVPARA